MRGRSFAALACGVWLSASTAFALSFDEVLPAPTSHEQGEVPLSEPLAPVRLGGPWALGARVGVGVADAFFSKVAFELDVRWRAGRWGVGGWGGRALSWANPNVTLCSAPGVCAPPKRERLEATPGRLGWMGGLGVVYRLADGKLSLGGAELSHFEMKLSADASAIGFRAENESRVAPGARIALGVSGDVAQNLALGLELASLLYVPLVRGERGLERQLLVGLALTWRPGGGK